jgi:hypothetical protein
MTRKFQEIALSFFLVVCSISLLMGMLWLKPLIASHQLFIDESRKNQEQMMKTANETKVIVTELGYAAAVIAMTENRMIQSTDANKMIEQSVVTIEAHSDRFGKLAKLINEYRINQQGRRR